VANLLNQKAVKEFALAVAEIRVKPFTRVSKEFITDLNQRLEDIIRDSVRNHPTKGKTIQQVR
jgi:hypothetical protein